MAENKEMINIREQNKITLDEILEKEGSIAPTVDIFETEDDFVMSVNLPGVKREDIQLKLDEGSLVIFGKVNYNEAINRKYILNENEIGNFYRKFRISNSIDESKIEAKFENGQLNLKLPKHDRIKPRNISIK
jgi:HSP20 family molecular chaperone IbpA